MAYVICEPCIGVKDKSCQEVCPVNCIVEGEDQLYIDPSLCIDCSLCVGVCPVSAIYFQEDVPDQWKSYIEKNANFFANK
ncbi:MAG: 4Fe-4S binding protein [Firmicutes bacterium]|jgi:Fe-S-cluster-containing hydrogenase component 2|nr:4Fe-4S binding protein [Bacillota bacterium]